MKLPEKINILLIGGGGREHAIATAIAKSERLQKLYIASGNGGSDAIGQNVDVEPTNFGLIKQFVLANNVNLVVVGPEEPLVRGIEDYFSDDDELKFVPVVGPSTMGAKLEGSKQFAKDFMLRHSIPTAGYKTFNNANKEEAADFLATLKAPFVLKADGLAAGKGVVILPTKEEALEELNAMIDGKFAAASKKVVIEEYLDGIELSVFVATDGKSYKLLPSAKDYKRIGEGDTGLNTGGMGAVSPVPFANQEFMDKVEQRIVIPTVEGIKKENIRYNGFIFIGLMNVAGDPFVIEYNVRLGDPETEVIIPRLESDIIDLFEGMVYGSLDTKEIKVSEQIATTVVCTAGGYPESYEKGNEITLPEACEIESTIYHAGTAKADDKLVTCGGRVLTVTSMGNTIEEALEKSYKTIDKIEYKDKYFRRDIGQDLIKLMK